MFWKFLRNNQTKSEASRQLCSLKKLFWKFLGKSFRQSAYWKLITMLNMSSATDIFLWISQKYQEHQFWKKIYWWMFHVSLKNTSGRVPVLQQHSKKILVEVNPPQSWPWKQNGTTVVATLMILEIVKKLRSMLQINIIFWKVRLRTRITFCYRKHSYRHTT